MATERPAMQDIVTVPFESFIPDPHSQDALMGTSHECICKMLCNDHNGKQVALLVGRTGLFGFQTGEHLAGRITDSGKVVELSGDFDSAYTLFEHPALPEQTVRLAHVLQESSQGTHRWRLDVDCSDVLAANEKLDERKSMKRAFTHSHSGCMLLLFAIKRVETVDMIGVDDSLEEYGSAMARA